jgi:hypothetical protein
MRYLGIDFLVSVFWENWRVTPTVISCEDLTLSETRAGQFVNHPPLRWTIFWVKAGGNRFFADVYNHKQNEKLFESGIRKMARSKRWTPLGNCRNWPCQFRISQVQRSCRIFELIRALNPVYRRRSDCSDKPKRSRQTIAHFVQPFRAMTPTAARLPRIIRRCSDFPRCEVYRRAQNLSEWMSYFCRLLLIFSLWYIGKETSSR